MPRLPELPTYSDQHRNIPTPTRGMPVVQPAPVSDASVRVANTVTKMAVEEAERLSDAAANDALNKLKERRLDLTYGEEKGFTKLQGGAVVNRPVTDEYPQMFQKEIEGIGAGLKGQLARDKFNARANAELQSYKADVYKHVAAQTDKFYTDTFNSTIAISAKEATTSPEFVNGALMRAGESVDKEIKRRGLTDANEIAVFKQEHIGAIHAAAIDGMLERNESQAASVYLKMNRDSMSQGQIDKLEKVVKAQSDWELGEVTATKAIDMDPKEAQDFIQKETKGNKAAYAAAQAVLTQREQAKYQAERNVKGGIISQFSASPNFSTMRKLQASKSYFSLSEEARGQLDEYMRHQVQMAEDRARGLNDRAERIERQRWDENVEALAIAQSIRDMPGFVELEPMQLNSYAPAIGPHLVSQLQKTLAQEKQQGAKFKFDQATLTSALPKSLLEPSKKDQKAAFIHLVNVELTNWKERNPGKIPSEEEQQSILRAGNKEYVRIGSIWNSEVPAYKVKPDDANSVPKDFYENLKKLGASESEIMKAWELKKSR